MNRIFYKGTKNSNRHKISLKAKAKDNKLQKELQINEFNIIELNEEEIKADYEPSTNLFSEREKQRLEKKAKSIEDYYSNKSEDENINENCFNCLMSNFKPNELLYFSKRKDLLIYLKYCFYFLKNILFLDHQIYIDNRYDLDKCDPNYLNGWKFFIPKTVCRACFLQIINMEHLFGNLKTIFSDIDPHIASRGLHRSRTHFNPRSRSTHSMRRINVGKQSDVNENGTKGKSNEKGSNRSKSKYRNGKNNNIISYDDEKGLISIKKDILGEVGHLINKKEENGKKVKSSNTNKSEYNHDLNHQNDEYSVTEIKIKASDFITEGSLSETQDKKEKDKDNKNNKDNKTNKNKDLSITKEKGKRSNSNNSSIKSININNNSKNEILNINSKNNDNGKESKDDKSNNSNSIKNLKNMNIFNDILNVKHMYNGIVIKLHVKLNVFKDILLYTIINIGDFKEKLINSMNFKPEIISYGINQYETYFSSLYNEGFKAKKEYEEMFTKIKNESIPSIFKKILKLKEEQLSDDEKSTLDDMEKVLDEYSKKIDEMTKRYDESMNNFFTNFICFFSLIKELKQAFSEQVY